MTRSPALPSIFYDFSRIDFPVPSIKIIFLIMKPNRYMTRRLALSLMATGWIAGFSIALIPVIWNKWDVAEECEFDQIFYPW